MTTTATRVRISCNCETCKTNAAKIGAAFPLVAEVNALMAEGLKITPRTANKPSKVHGLVYAAHDPSLRGSAQAAKFGPWAV